MADFNNYYRVYMDMQNVLKGDFTHNYLVESLSGSDTGGDTHSGKMYNRVIDMEWVEALEEAAVYIDKAIREHRRFIEQTEDIVPIEKAKKITSESVRHLAQHTNLIARVENDTVTPERILDIRREESFAIYENRFLHTLLNNASRFVEDRYKEMRNAPNDSFTKMHMTRQITVNRQIINFDITYSNESHEREKIDLDEDVSQLTDFERVRRIRRVFSDFMASPLIRNLSKCEPVRPPILHTNLMTKNTNFKKALDLWLFIETYRKKGFDVVGKEYSGTMEPDVQQELYNVLSFEHFSLQLADNPALRKMLQEKYEEENTKRESEKSQDEEAKAIDERIKEVREEEMQIRLSEILLREKQIKELNGTLDHQKISLHSMELKVKEMKATIAYNQEILNQNKEQITALQTDVLKAENTIKEQQANIDLLNRTIEEKENVIKGKQAEIDELNNTISEIRLKETQLLSQIDALTDVICKNEAAITELKNNLQQTTDSLQQQKNENSKLADNLKTKSQALSAAQENIQSLNTDIDCYKSNTKLLETKLKDADDKIKTEQEENHSLSSSLQSKQTELAAATAEIERINNEKAVLNDSIAKNIQEHKKQQEDALQQHQAKIAEQKAKFEAQLAAKDKQYTKAAATEQEKNKAQLKKIKQQATAEIKKNAKQTEQDAQNQIKQIKQETAQQIKAEKAKAKENIRLAAKINKSDSKRVLTVFNRDFLYGSAALQTMYMLSLNKNETTKSIDKIITESSRRINTLLLINNGKAITVNSFSQENARLEKKLKMSDFSQSFSELACFIKCMGMYKGAVITYSDSSCNHQAAELQQLLKDNGVFEEIITVQVTATQLAHSTNTMGIYYYKE